jgi:L-rhamnose isomerase/sugar isomerase
MQPDQIENHNQQIASHHDAELDVWAARLDRTGGSLDALLDHIAQLRVAIPSWALGAGGTRFGRFPVGGEPRDIFDKLQDIGVIQQLVRCTPAVSLHIPWDQPDDPAALRDAASDVGLSFDAMNSNTFEDQDTGQARSYKFGSMCHTDPAVREQAVEHNAKVIDIGKTLGSKALTVWLADGSNYPGQMHLRRSFDRTLESLRQVYDRLPDDWMLYTEHKPYEPAFYATVVQDWGSSLMLANALGDKAACLVDLGHHLPNCNIELVVARLITAGKLGGFHFNDSKYGDDDLTAGSIRPYVLFLVFHELVDAALDDPDFSPDYMIDQSHNVKDPIEALIQTADQLQQAFAKALLVDREALAGYQEANDVAMAEATLKAAYEADVRPLVAEARRRAGGALDPLAVLRAIGYRERVTRERGA